MSVFPLLTPFSRRRKPLLNAYPRDMAENIECIEHDTMGAGCSRLMHSTVHRLSAVENFPISGQYAHIRTLAPEEGSRDRQ